MSTDFCHIQDMFEDSDLDFISRDHSDSIWIISVIRDNSSIEYVMFDRNSKSVTRLFHECPELNEYSLSKMESITLNARDGMQL